METSASGSPKRRLTSQRGLPPWPAAVALLAFGVTLEGAGVPLPGETVLIAAGALVRRHEPHALGKVRPLQRPRRNRLGLGGGLARLLSVGKHKPGRALGRSSFTPLARCAGPRLAVALGVPEGHARMRTGQSAPPRRPGVVKGVQGRGCAENFRVGRT
jgi:hypothetical protein